MKSIVQPLPSIAKKKRPEEIRMKRMLLLLCLGVLFVPGVRSQGDHVEAGVFADYFRMSQTDNNYLGIGARAGLRVFPHLKLEGEMAYDFDPGFGEQTTNTGGTVVIQNANIHILHGLFGPKIEFGHGRVRSFVVVKGGFDRFFVNSCPTTFSCVSSQIANLRANDVNGVFYPGGGLEGHLGPVGLRLEAGDEMYFNNGTHHNLRMAFGPYIRF
jgi:hypothetical protein